MMPLNVCREIVGTSSLILEDPSLTTHHDVLYVPMGLEPVAAGVYDRTRKILPGGGHVVGVPSLHYQVGDAFTTLDAEDYAHAADQDYIFIGALHSSHYGHFLVGGLARFWFLEPGSQRTPKFLYLDMDPPETLFSPPYARLLFETLGLKPADFVRFDAPVRIRSLTVAATSFEENNCVHTAYARMCNRLGDLLTRDTSPGYIDRPVYLSKHRLAQGVSTVLNEDKFCESLERLGVDIVFPEQLGLIEQINLFRSRPMVSGIIGSAFHTSVFVPKCRLLIMNHEQSVWSNQVLQDKANANQTLYLYPTSGLDNQGATDSFGNNFVFESPQEMAGQFYRAIEAYLRAFAQAPAHGEQHNVALRKPTRQSSVHPFANGTHIPISRHGAVSGFVTGGYQFHTDNEDQPWWEVDLLTPHRISSIRIYNRLDDAAWRASGLVCLVSADSERWTELFRHEDERPFGGIDGAPLVWTGEHLDPIRFVRLQIPHHEDFHLDQVEIIGISERHGGGPRANEPPPRKAPGGPGWPSWIPRSLRSGSATRDNPSRS